MQSGSLEQVLLGLQQLLDEEGLTDSLVSATVNGPQPLQMPESTMVPANLLRSLRQRVLKPNPELSVSASPE